MESKHCYTLQIDREFRNLIRPLHRAEYLQLEANIMSDGCRDPIITWQGVIIDGHNRYEICHRHDIPFAVEEMEFSCREEAIAWICANQLGRRNITEETRKFLIGMQYESEKIVNKLKNARGLNQYSGFGKDGLPFDEKRNKHRTAERIAQENHISQGTVQKYAEYTRSLEEVGRKVPELVPKILSGRYKISHSNLVELAKLDEENLKKMARRIEHTQQPYIQYKQTRQEIQRQVDRTNGEGGPIPSVKDMPEFDPDAEITGLTLTIPSWSSSIDRMRARTNLGSVSCAAKDKLAAALSDLQARIDEMLLAIKED